MARGVKAENIIPLTGDYANRATLTRAAEALLSQLTCTDAALLYITAVSANTQGMSMVMTNGLYEDDWIAGLSDRFPIMRAVTDASPFLLLNPPARPKRKSCPPPRCRTLSRGFATGRACDAGPRHHLCRRV